MLLQIGSKLIMIIIESIWFLLDFERLCASLSAKYLNSHQFKVPFYASGRLKYYMSLFT